MENELIRKTYIITPEIEQALKLKAVMENRQLNEIVREIFKSGIEKKYFDMIDQESVD